MNRSIPQFSKKCPEGCDNGYVYHGVPSDETAVKCLSCDGFGSIFDEEALEAWLDDRRTREEFQRLADAGGM